MKYKGQELKEIVITQNVAFNPPKTFLVWDDDDEFVTVAKVSAIIPLRGVYALFSQSYLNTTSCVYKDNIAFPPHEQANSNAHADKTTQDTRCKFCGETLDRENMARGNYGAIVVVQPNATLGIRTYYLGEGPTATAVNINYCPMCGRKLEAEK